MTPIPIDKILPNPEQPRKIFNQEELEALANSIRENDVIEPIVVEWTDAGMYILHDGERRLRAAKLAGLTEIPASVVAPSGDIGPAERLVRALVANIQRADLSPIEEGQSYARLRDEMGLSINQIAIRLGIGIGRVEHRLQLLELDPPIQNLIESGKLSKDKRLVDALQSISDSESRIKMAQTLAERRASIKASVEACDKLNHHLQSEKFPKAEIPAAHLAVRRSGDINRARWDAFAQIGKLPPWALMEISVRDTCKGCSLYDMASDSTCRECPLVSLLAVMIGKSR